MNSNLEKALLNMGYRKLKASKWGKPVGFHFLLYEEDKDIISNWFQGKDDGKHHIWNEGHILADTEEEMIILIKSFEASTRLNMTNYDTKFEFLTIEQLIEL